MIKKKADLIDSEKYANNKVMDQLISELGYMDYRDALACNKYILEAKRSGDYHQLARSRVLELALSGLDQRRRTELERSAAKQASNSVEPHEDPKSSADQIKLNMLMRQDPSVAVMFQDELHQIRDDKEADVRRVDAIHKRFDYLRDADSRAGRLHSAAYDDVPSEDYEDHQPSTQLEDPEDHEIYTRYKVARNKSEVSVERLQDTITALRRKVKDAGGLEAFGGEARLG